MPGWWMRHVRECLRGAHGTWLLQGMYAHPIGDRDHWFFDPVKVIAGNDNGR